VPSVHSAWPRPLAFTPRMQIMDMTCETDTTVSLERLVRIERDNALMLSYILDTNSIGNFRLPPGTTMNDVNYGAIDVADMISRLRRSEVVDLTTCMNESCTVRTLEKAESTRAHDPQHEWS
jgi:hypothetical protein